MAISTIIKCLGSNYVMQTKLTTLLQHFLLNVSLNVLCSVKKPILNKISMQLIKRKPEFQIHIKIYENVLSRRLKIPYKRRKNLRKLFTPSVGISIYTISVFKYYDHASPYFITLPCWNLILFTLPSRALFARIVFKSKLRSLSRRYL